jgi:hypothetical protein
MARETIDHLDVTMWAISGAAGIYLGDNYGFSYDTIVVLVAFAVAGYVGPPLVLAAVRHAGGRHE